MNDPIILDANRLRAYFDSIARDFQTTPQQMMVFALILMAALTALVLLAWYQVRLVRAGRRVASARKAAALAASAKLTARQAELVASLTALLRNPREQAHLLLSNVAVYDRAAGALLATAPQRQREVASLRVKLQLGRAHPEQRVVSSADLAPGQRVMLLQPTVRARARVTAAAAEALKIRLERQEQQAAPTIGAAAQLVLARQSGIYQFRTTVLAVDDTEVSIAHSETVRRAQQRAHFRRSMSIAVGVRRRTGAEDANWARVRLLDLGGNGASVANAGLNAGDGVSLRIPDRPPLQMEANVVRTSRRGRVAHLQFADVRENDRDRVYRLILDSSTQRRERNAPNRTGPAAGSPVTTAAGVADRAPAGPGQPR